MSGMLGARNKMSKENENFVRIRKMEALGIYTHFRNNFYHENKLGKTDDLKFKILQDPIF